MQIGRQGQHSLRQGRETLAQFSEWMLNRGFLFPRSALSAAKSYSAGQLRLTWLDAGLPASIQTFLQLCGDPFADVACLPMLLESSSNNSMQQLLFDCLPHAERLMAAVPCMSSSLAGSVN